MSYEPTGGLGGMWPPSPPVSSVPCVVGLVGAGTGWPGQDSPIIMAISNSNIIQKLKNEILCSSPRSIRGGCYDCKSEGLLKFLGSVRIKRGRQ